MTNDGMLVRAAGGDWERLAFRPEVPDGSFSDLFGEDLGPVIGSAKSMPVLAVAPPVAGAAPDVVCGSADGGLALVRLALGAGKSDSVLGDLLGCAGAFHGLSVDEFVELCGVGKMDELASRVMGGTPPKAARESWSTALSHTLASGGFQLVALVSETPEAALASMRFLNRSGSAQIRCLQVQLFSSASVTALQLSPLDTGLAPAAQDATAGASASSARAGTGGGAAAPQSHATRGSGKQPRETSASAAAQSQSAAAAAARTAQPSSPKGQLITAIAGSAGEPASKLADMLADELGRIFDKTDYSGEGTKSTVKATMTGVGDDPVHLIELDGAGIIHIDFESLGPVDGDWSMRAELAQGMERLLGADLGDVRKISKLNVVIAEHLMDSTLMEAFTELVGDIVATVRKDAEATIKRARELEAAAAAA